jgi:hypothetical protein
MEIFSSDNWNAMNGSKNSVLTIAKGSNLVVLVSLAFAIWPVLLLV